MGSLREIKDRIGSVKSTLKITSAMKMVASSKLRKAQKAIESMLPYRKALEEILKEVPAAAGIKAEAKSDRTIIVAIASNSSLCGGFNANAAKAALEEASRHENVEIIAVGRKMSDAVRKAGFPQKEDLSELSGKPSYDAAGAFAQSLLDRFTEGGCGKVMLVYNHFVSTSRQVPVVEQFLPVITAQQDGQEETELTKEDDEYILEPDAEEIARELMPQVQRLKMFTALLDSAAAEHAARTIAMQTASDNAEEILSELTLEYNKGRQQKITAEILDLVGGMAE